jgi:competence protein ComEC
MWLPFIYVRWLFWLVVGILWEIWGNGYALVGWIGFIGSVIGFALSHFFLPARWRVAHTWIIGAFASLVLVNFGVVLTHNRIERYDKRHFLHQKNIEAYTTQIVQEPQDKTRSYRAVGEIQQIKVAGKWQASQGKVLLYFRKEAGKFDKLQYGNIYIVKGSPQEVPPPSNPAMFDFREYLAYQNVYHQQFLSPEEVQQIGHEVPNYLMYFAIYLRGLCMRIFDTHVVGGQESALATALVLGIKDDVEADILEAYTVTGLMHILAVSGMHVGLLMTVPMYFFKPLQRKTDKKSKRKKVGFVVAMIVGLFFYALLTGLSASISRAVVMCSFLLVGKVLGKRGSLYNILALSAFVLLIWEPFWILNVGFQLSYLAVLGIFYIQPRIERWITPNTAFMREVWSIVTITISAQIATTPISLFYFHQFPNYFLISNLLAVPISNAVLYTVLLLLLFNWIPYLSTFLGFIASSLIWFTNQIIFFIQKMPAQLSDGIWLEWWEVIFLYAFVVFFLMTWELHKTRYWLYAVVCLGFFTGSRTVRYWQQNSQKMLVVYHLNKQDNVTIFEGHHAYVIGDSTLRQDKKSYNFNLKNHFYRQGVTKPVYILPHDKPKLPFALVQKESYKLLEFGGKTCLILPTKQNARDLVAFENIETDFCLLQNRAVFSFNALPESLHKSIFILSPSMPPSYTRNLKREADSLKIKLYHVATQGAFVMKIR